MTVLKAATAVQTKDRPSQRAEALTVQRPDQAVHGRPDTAEEADACST